MLAHPVKYSKYNTPEQVRVRYESQADFISSNCDGGSDGNDGNSSDGHTTTCSCGLSHGIRSHPFTRTATIAF